MTIKIKEKKTYSWNFSLEKHTLSYISFAAVAQLVERSHGKGEVTGSIPVGG